MEEEYLAKRRALKEQRDRKLAIKNERHEFLVKEAEKRFEKVYKNERSNTQSPFKCGHLIRVAE